MKAAVIFLIFQFQFKMLEYMGCWKLDLNNNSKIINPVDLNGVNDKVLSRDYKTLDNFLADIEWIHHNCHIYFSGMFDIIIEFTGN